MRNSRVFVLSIVLLFAIVIGTAPRVIAQDATPNAEVAATPISEILEIGPVFATGGLRITVIGAVRSSGINSLGLRRSEGKDWVAVVADVQNNGTAEVEFKASSVSLWSYGESLGGYAKKTTGSLAAELGTNPQDANSSFALAPREVLRFTWVFSIENSTDEIDFGNEKDFVSLEEPTSSSINLRDLPATMPRPTLTEALVDRVIDGSTLAVYLPSTEENVTIEMYGLDSPKGDDCYADQSTEDVESLVGSTIWLETPSPSTVSMLSQAAKTNESTDSLTSFVWEELDGQWVMLNQVLIASGSSGYEHTGDLRYESWMSNSEDVASEAGVGLWSVCSGTHGEPLPSPTPIPEPTPTPAPAVGTRENPIPFGEVIDLGNDYEFGIVDVNPDAYGALVAENQFNEPAGEGKQYFMATVQVTYTGPDSVESGGGYGYKAVGQSGVAYESGWDCGVVPDELENTEMFTGAVLTGNLCWEIRSEDADTLVMYLGDGSNRIYFSLKRP